MFCEVGFAEKSIGVPGCILVQPRYPAAATTMIAAAISRSFFPPGASEVLSDPEPIEENSGGSTVVAELVSDNCTTG